MKCFDATPNISKLKINKLGEIEELGINGQSVPLASDVSLEDNKKVTITENGEIEITPSTGKDGMKKVTATVNVSGGGSNKLYAWGSLGSEVYTITATPTTDNTAIWADNWMREGDIEEVGEDTITVQDRGTLTRYPDGDFQM
jgi:hypothetical protein